MYVWWAKRLFLVVGLILNAWEEGKYDEAGANCYSSDFHMLELTRSYFHKGCVFKNGRRVLFYGSLPTVEPIMTKSMRESHLQHSIKFPNQSQCAVNLSALYKLVKSTLVELWLMVGKKWKGLNALHDASCILIKYIQVNANDQKYPLQTHCVTL